MDEKIPLPKKVSIRFTLDNKGRFCEIPLVADKTYQINSSQFGLRYLAVVLEYSNKSIKVFSPELKSKTKLLKNKDAEINFTYREKFYYFKVEVLEIMESGEFIIKMPDIYNQDQRRNHVRAYHSHKVRILRINSETVGDLDGSNLSLDSKDLSATGLKLYCPVKNLKIENIKLIPPPKKVQNPQIGLEFTLEKNTFALDCEVVWAHR